MHGDLPMYVPPEQPSEEWELYTALSAPIGEGECGCHAICECEEPGSAPRRA